MDIDAEREKITQEIQELERILYPGSTSVHFEVSESSLSSDSEADSLPDEDLETAGAPILRKGRVRAAMMRRTPRTKLSLKTPRPVCS